MKPGLEGQTIERGRRLQAGCDSGWPKPSLRRRSGDNLEMGSSSMADSPPTQNLQEGDAGRSSPLW